MKKKRITGGGEGIDFGSIPSSPKGKGEAGFGSFTMTSVLMKRNSSTTHGSFDELLALLSSHLERQNTSFRRSIPAVERLIITLK
ncbi:hypothetical protein AB205_0077380 [Aquarana catesbeiana]|uniref:Uncharacterized protein n=1 Tax=Aquarana catesbeiana TaxID=8400 RepID=A0A2G9PVJ8_AQUCT|nr:hypothetical protein AB205_0077380 [Aquarana catesbeiana]